MVANQVEEFFYSALDEEEQGKQLYISVEFRIHVILKSTMARTGQ